jgi:hypothetical protein
MNESVLQIIHWCFQLLGQDTCAKYNANKAVLLFLAKMTRVRNAAQHHKNPSSSSHILSCVLLINKQKHTICRPLFGIPILFSKSPTPQAEA